jgi:hypothetical protein
MARTTIADLQARIDQLEEELEALRNHVNEQAAAPAIQYVRELKAPLPISEPLDFLQMASELGQSQAYSDPDWWGATAYI